MFGLGWQELLIILVIAIVLFGGTRLAGIGKASGRAIREFKEETKGLKDVGRQSVVQESDAESAGQQDHTSRPTVVEGEVVKPDPRP